MMLSSEFANVSGPPSLGLPCGKIGGLPQGEHLTGPLGQEARLLSVVRQIAGVLDAGTGATGRQIRRARTNAASIAGLCRLSALPYADPSDFCILSLNFLDYGGLRATVPLHQDRRVLRPQGVTCQRH